MAPNRDCCGHHLCGCFESRGDVAVSLLQYANLVRRVSPQRQVAGGAAHVDHSIQRFDVHNHHLGGILSQIRIFGEHDCHWFAHVANPILGQDRLKRPLKSEAIERQPERNGLNMGDISTGKHQTDAGHGLSC